MNIEFQMCGFIICLMMLILYVSKQTLKMYSEKIFLRTFLVNLILLVADMVSVVAIKYQNSLPSMFVKFVCKFYVALLLLETCMALIYILYDVIDDQKHKRLTKILLGITLLENIVVFCVPIYIFSEGRVVYTYGPSTMVVYACVAVYFLAILGVAFLKKKQIYQRRWFAFMLWICIWIAAGVAQFIDPTKLVVGFASSLGMIILYIMLESPESNLNRRLGCFNSYALGNYISELFQRKESFFVIFLNFEHGGDEKNIKVRELLSYTKRHKNACVFKELNMDFLIITKSEGEYEDMMRWAQEQKEEETGILRNVDVFSMKNGLEVIMEKNIHLIFQYFLRHWPDNENNAVCELTPKMIEEFIVHEKMLEEIKSALDEDRVEVFLQPIYSTHTNTFTSAEALVRIRKEDKSIIPPGLFIPVAEQTGLIVELGERVFEKTCQFISERRIWEYGIKYIEINLSVLQCEQEQLADCLTGIMDKYQVEPARINLEITETATLNAKKKLLANMEKLLDKGCSFSLDDFGKGESNLMYIVEMPVSILKLDYDMTKAFFQIPKAKNVVESVVTMAHNMGLLVVAEGIETKEELEAMTEQHIDYIQGYYFSKPLPMDEFYDLIQNSEH